MPASNQTAYPVPPVGLASGLREASGPTDLTVGAVPDLTMLARSGTGIVGQTPKVDVGCDDLNTILATSANAHYERHPTRPGLVVLKASRTFRDVADALTNPMASRVWTNSSKVLSAACSGGKLTLNGVTSSNYDWWPSTYTAPFLPFGSYAPGWASAQRRWMFRIGSQNANENYELAAMTFVDSTSNANGVRFSVGYASASVDWTSIGAAAASTVGITRGQQQAGVWGLVWEDGANMYAAYSVAAAQPTKWSDWTTLTAINIDLRLKTLKVGLMAYRVGAVSGSVDAWCDYYDDREALPFGTSPVWADASDAPTCASGYPTAGDAITLATVDFGRPVLPSQATMRLILADAENRLPGDAASWTYSLTGSDSASPAAATTYQAATALNPKQPSSDTTETTARRYWTLRCKGASSGGTQAGSLDTALIRIVN